MSRVAVGVVSRLAVGRASQKGRGTLVEINTAIVPPSLDVAAWDDEEVVVVPPLLTLCQEGAMPSL